MEIKIYPDEVLKKKAGAVLRVDAEIKKLADDMIETMQAEDGAGLAGPQVGVSKRIFVIDLGQGSKVFINPKIFKKRGRQVDWEGCLSFPGLEAKVKRAKSLVCEFLDKEGKLQKIEAKDLLARVILHENDHLEGVLFIDRVNFLRRRKLLREYKKRGV